MYVVPNADFGAPFDRVIVRECVVPGVPGVCDWSRFTVRGAIFLSVDHGLAAGTEPTFVGSLPAAAH